MIYISVLGHSLNAIFICGGTKNRSSKIEAAVFCDFNEVHSCFKHTSTYFILYACFKCICVDEVLLQAYIFWLKAFKNEMIYARYYFVA